MMNVVFSFDRPNLLVSTVPPDPVLSSAASAPAAPLLRGWLPSPPRTSPGLSPPKAAQCAAASPLEPPAAPWCQKSFGRTGQTSQSAGKIQRRTKRKFFDVNTFLGY